MNGSKKRPYVGICKGCNTDGKGLPEIQRCYWSISDIARIARDISFGGALFMKEHGRNNPHLQTVSDAERIAKRSV